MEQNRFKRLWQHWQNPRWRVEQYFPTKELERLSRAIGESERSHSGQVRFVVESRYDSADVLAGVQPHTRALQWFGELGIWDTERNSGVLVYVSFADHVVEIVADRGIHAKVGNAAWQQVCADMAAAFKQQQYVAGLEQGLNAVTALLAEHFPKEGDAPHHDELDNEIVLA